MAHSLVQGRDYQDTIEVFPKQFPSRSIISWRQPDAFPTKTGVWAYNALTMGNYDGGSPQTPVQPRQVQSLADYSETISLAYEANPDEFNILSECYLTGTAGANADKLFELGWFYNSPARTRQFHSDSEQIGLYVDSNGGWKVARSGTYLMFMPEDGGQFLKGHVDKSAALSWLREKGIVSGLEWINGTAIGSEPLRGSGVLYPDIWSPSIL